MTPEIVPKSPLRWIDWEFIDGYRDGRDKLAPEPSGNRSEAYRHSFAVGRAELAGCPITAAVSRERAQRIEARSDETPEEAVQPGGREPDGEADAPRKGQP